MKSARKPARSTVAANRIPPVNTASVSAAVPGSALVAVASTATAVRTEIMDVVLTDSGRDVPSKA
jgi:hypothetical protein